VKADEVGLLAVARSCPQLVLHPQPDRVRRRARPRCHRRAV